MIKFIKPEQGDLTYRQSLMADPDTMEYNAGYEDSIPYYDYATGCIDFTEERWVKWYNRVADNPNNFYAYVYAGEISVGEVFFAENGSVSLIIEAKHRGNGYAKQALEMLIEIAFKDYNKPILINNIPEDREISLKLFKKLGFTVKDSYNTLRFKQPLKVLNLELKNKG